MCWMAGCTKKFYRSSQLRRTVAKRNILRRLSITQCMLELSRSHKSRGLASMPRRPRASRRPRPTEPPPGYDGNYSVCRNIPVCRRPRPPGAPPAIVNEVYPSSSDQVANGALSSPASVVAEGTELAGSGGKARSLMTEGKGDQHATGLRNAELPPTTRRAADTSIR